MKYHGGVKTVVISGASRPPQGLQDIMERGSTSVATWDAKDVASTSTLAHDADRIVFWHSRGDVRLGSLAAACAAGRTRQGGEAIVFVTDDDAHVPAGLGPDELFVWPRDEDRLKMAFMTGA